MREERKLLIKNYCFILYVLHAAPAHSSAIRANQWNTEIAVNGWEWASWAVCQGRSDVEMRRREDQEWVNTGREAETSVWISLISILLITPLDKICFEWRWLPLYHCSLYLSTPPPLSSSLQLVAPLPLSHPLSVLRKISLSLSDAVHFAKVLKRLALWTRVASFQLEHFLNSWRQSASDDTKVCFKERETCV